MIKKYAITLLILVALNSSINAISNISASKHNPLADIKYSMSDYKKSIPSELGFGAAGFTASFANICARSFLQGSARNRTVHALDAFMVGALLVAFTRDLQKKSNRYDTVYFLGGALAGGVATQLPEAGVQLGAGLGFLGGGISGLAAGAAARASGRFAKSAVDIENIMAVGGANVGGVIGGVSGIAASGALFFGSTAITAMKVSELTTE